MKDPTLIVIFLLLTIAVLIDAVLTAHLARETRRQSMVIMAWLRELNQKDDRRPEARAMAELGGWESSEKRERARGPENGGKG